MLFQKRQLPFTVKNSKISPCQARLVWQGDISWFLKFVTSLLSCAIIFSIQSTILHFWFLAPVPQTNGQWDLEAACKDIANSPDATGALVKETKLPLDFGTGVQPCQKWLTCKDGDLEKKEETIPEAGDCSTSNQGTPGFYFQRFCFLPINSYVTGVSNVILFIQHLPSFKIE